MKKGFTLIELLAVIVILAIIALIVAPIILGIINDARRKSNERSVELYASAVRNAIASYQLTHPNAPTLFDDLDVQYDGNVVCATEELYADGSFYIADCTANGDAVDYTYGEQQVTQPIRYYYFGYDWDGKVGEPVTLENPSTVPPTGKNFYLGYEVTDGVVSTGYVCFIKNETEYCLKGYSTEEYVPNTEVLTETFGEGDCDFGDNYVQCRTDGFSVVATSDGYVHAIDDISTACDVYATGGFNCFDYWAS